MNILLNKIFVGLPEVIGSKYAENPMAREWESAIFKKEVDAPIWVGKTNLAGDGQADLRHHGGPEKAVFAYPAEHYLHWQQELGISDINPGGMGENFSMMHVNEGQISIGDTYEIGDAIIQVSQPRQPCWKPARRFMVKNLALLLQNSGKTGWYFRVLQEGFVEEGQPCNLVNRPSPKWTIDECNNIMHVEKDDFKKAAELAECEWLAVNWKTTLLNRINKHESPDISKRIYGPNV